VSISLSSNKFYLIRIYIDGVNAVTGRTSSQPDEQDYIITPSQRTLRKFKPSPNAAMVLFRCPPLFQPGATKKNSTNIQIEVTTHEMKEHLMLHVRDMRARIDAVLISLYATVDKLREPHEAQSNCMWEQTLGFGMAILKGTVS
jgi:hypothetical protein